MKGNNFNHILYIFILSAIVFGCDSLPMQDATETEKTDNLIQITQEQFESDKMQIGEVSLQLFEDVVVCNGFITSPPNGMAQISTPISGIVESINCAFGDYVKKGQVLCMLTSTELLVLQQDFAETAANLKRIKSDYERSKALYEEKIGAEKDFIAIESEYQITQARYQSLKLRLEFLDLDAMKVGKGQLYSSFPVKAPIEGYITNQDIILGQFIELQKILMEIVDVNKLQLQLSVFENDVNHIKTGQKIQFFSLGKPNNSHSATLISIGKAINKETKTIKCIAKIDQAEEVDFVNNSYIEAKIPITQMEAKALPSEAIIKSGQDYYVLVLEKSDDQNYYLRKVNVKIGRVSEGFTEIIGDEELANVVTQGVYNLSAD